ncbi:MAG: hypothetical protein GWO16_09015 [Gammaproteobacteria bacterium]|nr:hypothetical protein [Gammaproteobacteria bacterium]NIR98108.1 hypothetical protein [Gammaproteobacteria bacterium]NIT62263.1 hypothetical protein [Gammaproteobacteria bacterium]NIV19114.1 hypothetical protein [Gammaproteobacteria bacterium]NIY30843.1 hypothetical protein [Gammaproteobacteria bacterium]
MAEPVRVPVYSERNGMPSLHIFRETEDGTFARTAEQPFRGLKDQIEGIGEPVGELISRQSDRESREWGTPTVVPECHAAKSYYRFLREQLERRRFFVLLEPERTGHITRLRLHELKLKPNASQRARTLLAAKYREAVDLWTEHERERNAEQAAQPERAVSF